MKHNKHIAIAFVISITSTSAFAKIDLSATLNCTYQKGQILDKNTSDNVTNSTPLNWTFNGLASKNPIFVSGGETGRVIAIPIETGIIIYLPSDVGTSTFTIWSSGESFWGKQTNLLGSVYSQQFIGSCEN